LQKMCFKKKIIGMVQIKIIKNLINIID